MASLASLRAQSKQAAPHRPTQPNRHQGPSKLAGHWTRGIGSQGKGQLGCLEDLNADWETRCPCPH